MLLEQQAERRTTVDQSRPPEASRYRLRFAGDAGFLTELRRRIEVYFRSTGQRQRDCPQMYFKSAIILAWLAASYVLLVFAVEGWWQCLLLAVSLGLAMAAVGFNIQHDAGHRAYSRYPWVNTLAAMMLDLIGGSSYLWHWKHGVFHHTYVNITGHDTDIDLGMVGRLSPHQKRWSFHRWQHFYLWAAYGLMAIRWHLYGDFRDIITGTVGTHHVPRPKGWDLVCFVGGKLTFLSLAFALPMCWHPWWAVLLCYAVVAVVAGIVLSVVFQLAHAVEESDFPMPDENTLRLPHSWAIHQTQTTVDFARKSRVLAWLLGGLNFQIEHHLFPQICHVNYPDLAPIVEQTCKEFGVKYAVHHTFRSGMASHYRWLRRMGASADAETLSRRDAPNRFPGSA